MTDDATYRKMKQERDLALAECALLNGTLESRERNIETLQAECERRRADAERLRGVLDEIATINSLTATQPQFIRYLQNTAQAALCEGKDPDACWNTRCNLGHKCRSALGESK